MLESLKSFFRVLKWMHQPDAAAALGELLEEYRLRKKVMHHHPQFVVEPGVILLGYSQEYLSVSQGRVAKGTILSFGDSVTGYGKISIGSGTWIGQYNNIRSSHAAPITIGKKCLISQFCTLIGANHNLELDRPIMDQSLEERRSGIILGDDVWLGAGVVVLPGVTIGTGAVVGAGSIVTRNIPDHEIWLGNPARKHRERS